LPIHHPGPLSQTQASSSSNQCPHDACRTLFSIDQKSFGKMMSMFIYAGYPSTTRPKATIILQRPKPPWCLSWLSMYHPSCRQGKLCTAHSLQGADRYYPRTAPAAGKDHLGSFCSTPSPHGVAIQKDNAKALTSVEIHIFEPRKENQA